MGKLIDSTLQYMKNRKWDGLIYWYKAAIRNKQDEDAAESTLKLGAVEQRAEADYILALRATLLAWIGEGKPAWDCGRTKEEIIQGLSHNTAKDLKDWLSQTDTQSAAEIPVKDRQPPAAPTQAAPRGLPQPQNRAAATPVEPQNRTAPGGAIRQGQQALAGMQFRPPGQVQRPASPNIALPQVHQSPVTAPVASHRRGSSGGPVKSVASAVGMTIADLVEECREDLYAVKPVKNVADAGWACLDATNFQKSIADGMVEWILHKSKNAKKQVGVEQTVSTGASITLGRYKWSQITQIAEKCIKHKAAVCTSFACYAAYVLGGRGATCRIGPRIEIVAAPNHVFCLVGRKGGFVSPPSAGGSAVAAKTAAERLTDASKWGDETIVVDCWLGSLGNEVIFNSWKDFKWEVPYLESRFDSHAK